MKEYQFVDEGGETALVLKDEVAFQLATMHGQTLPDGIYRIELNLSDDHDAGKLTLIQVGSDHEQTIKMEESENGFSAEIDINMGKMVKISGIKDLKIEGIVLTKKP